MLEIAYTPNPGKIKNYFDKIQQAGIPQKVDKKWLQSIGAWVGGNDAYLISILKFIGFIDSAGTTTELWKLYKDPTKAGIAIAKGMKIGYKELFDTYPDANRKDKEAIYAFFSAKTGKAKDTIDRMVATFFNLGQLANFEEEAKTEIRIPKPPIEEIKMVNKEQVDKISSEIHINIQLHLPATTDPAIYDNLFKSLRKNLLSENE
jgi:hypothetical protein